MKEAQCLLQPVGAVSSLLISLKDCPKQGSEGAPDAWLEIDPLFSDALDGLVVGCEIIVLTWLHESQRDLLKVHPRGDANKPLRGVFATRSPDRPNPVGLHRVKILDMSTPCRLRVGPLEALNGTPIIDIKPVLHEPEEL
jgi:tRNA-Thr(GGU) m(6)t(6)A37 methyltransferase TsaA